MGGRTRRVSIALRINLRWVASGGEAKVVMGGARKREQYAWRKVYDTRSEPSRLRLRMLSWTRGRERVRQHMLGQRRLVRC